MSYLTTFANVAGAIMQGNNDAYNAAERAQTDRFNAIVAEQEAKSEIDTARADASDFRRAQSAKLASSRAAQAGSGFTAAGSPMLISQAALAEVEFGVSRIVHKGLLAENRLKTKAQLLRREAGVEDANASYARQAGVIGALGAVAKGVSIAAQGVTFG